MTFKSSLLLSLSLASVLVLSGCHSSESISWYNAELSSQNSEGYGTLNSKQASDEFILPFGRRENTIDSKFDSVIFQNDLDLSESVSLDRFLDKGWKVCSWYSESYLSRSELRQKPLETSEYYLSKDNCIITFDFDDKTDESYTLLNCPITTYSISMLNHNSPVLTVYDLYLNKSTISDVIDVFGDEPCYVYNGINSDEVAELQYATYNKTVYSFDFIVEEDSEPILQTVTLLIS